jgi:hypothetical protein
MTWDLYLANVRAAVAQQDVPGAVRAWHDAYAVAEASRSWDGLFDLGDEVLKIGALAGIAKAAEPKARRLYLAAFLRARRDGSLDGALRAAEAFAALGDRVVLEQAVRLVAELAEREGPDVRDRCRDTVERLRQSKGGLE